MISDLKRKIGTRVRIARRHRAMTQEDLAEAIDRTVETVSNIERGRTLPSIDTLEQLGRHLRFHFGTFFAIGEGHKGANRRRYELEGRLLEAIRSLSDQDDEIAVGQIEIIARVRGRRRWGQQGRDSSDRGPDFFRIRQVSVSVPASPRC
ncbi:MAG: helix-turn-helix domain-containing protein [Dongiaceae bacterium]